MKYYALFAFLGMFASLASAGFFLLKDKKNEAGGSEKRMVWALTWRISISVALFLSILLFWQLGWIKPTGLPVG